MSRKILVLGGYGNFGRLICRELACKKDLELVISGRNEKKADQLVTSLQNQFAGASVSTLVLDIFSEAFVRALSDLNPFLVIHTSGPFQGQDYRIPRACVETGSHYIDLADDRRFVCDFHTLNALAESTGSIAICGASSVPGLSSVVIDRYAKEFDKIEVIDFSIIPGSNVELGEATLQGILSYLGQPFEGWLNGKLVDLYGWMDIRRYDFGNTLGTRWLANVNIPDLELFRKRYPGVKTVRFQSGHELTVIHLTLALMGLLAKYRLVNRWDRYTIPIYKMGQRLKWMGSDMGGMYIRITGINQNGVNQTLVWKCIAPNGTGPHIPTFSALILTEMLLNKQITEPMAVPCLGMYELDAFSAMADKYGISHGVERLNG